MLSVECVKDVKHSGCVGVRMGIKMYATTEVAILEEVREFCHEHSQSAYVCWGMDGAGRRNVHDQEQGVQLQSVGMLRERREMRW